MQTSYHQYTLMLTVITSVNIFHEEFKFFLAWKSLFSQLLIHLGDHVSVSHPSSTCGAKVIPIPYFTKDKNRSLLQCTLVLGLGYWPGDSDLLGRSSFKRYWSEKLID